MIFMMMLRLLVMLVMLVRMACMVHGTLQFDIGGSAKGCELLA